MDHTWVTPTKKSNVAKRVTLGKNGSQVIKWVTVRKMGHTWKNGSHFEKLVILAKIGHT